MRMSSQNNTSANVSAQVSVTPILSQSVLTTILLISVIPLSGGFYFLWHDKEGTWIPFSLFIALIIIVCVGWWRSQNSIDMGNSNPTQISDRHGNLLTTDTRVLESDNAVAQLGVLLQSIGARNPLPEPDGLVDSSGLEILGSKNKAIKLVDDINSALSTQTQELVNSAAHDSSQVAQAVVDPPAESNEGVLEHNQVEVGSST